MRDTYLIVGVAWVMFGCMAVVALSARRRSKKIDRWMEEDRQRRSGQSREHVRER